MRRDWEESNIADVIDQAQQTVYELAEEMREAFEALPEQLKEYHVRRRETAEWLEVASDFLTGLTAYHIRPENSEVRWVVMRPGKDGKLNRPERRDNVVRSVQASIFRIAELPEHDENLLKLIGDLKRVRDILKSLEFPGMSI